MRTGRIFPLLGDIPRAIINDGEDLPRNGTVDDAYLDLPADTDLKEKVKRGSVADTVAYIHAKPSPGGIIGERVGDWEHITLRLDSYRGVLKAIYLSHHAVAEPGSWHIGGKQNFFENSSKNRSFLVAF
ncbi:putative vacuolar protein sorting-associated protein 62 [Tanacetum coccineum]